MKSRTERLRHGEQSRDGYPDDTSPASYRGTEQLDQLERRPLGHHSVHGAVLRPSGRFQRQGGEIFDMHGPDPVLAIAADGEDRETPEQPGDVVVQDPPLVKEDRRPQDCVGEAALLDGGLEGFSGGGAGREPTVKSAAWPCEPGWRAGFKEGAAVLDRQGVVNAAPHEAHRFTCCRGW